MLPYFVNKYFSIQFLDIFTPLKLLILPDNLLGLELIPNKFTRLPMYSISSKSFQLLSRESVQIDRYPYILVTILFIIFDKDTLVFIK